MMPRPESARHSTTTAVLLLLRVWFFRVDAQVWVVVAVLVLCRRPRQLPPMPPVWEEVAGEEVGDSRVWAAAAPQYHGEAAAEEEAEASLGRRSLG